MRVHTGAMGRPGFVRLGLVWLAACLGAGGFLAFQGFAALGGSGAPQSAAGEPVVRPVADVYAATSPAPSHGTLRYHPIEQVRVGQRVVTPGTDPARPTPTAVDPATWKRVKIRVDGRWEDGTADPVEVDTLQPPGWLAEHGVRVGARVPLPVDLAEMGLEDDPDAPAVVTAVEPCPPVELGPGRVVLATLTHLNNFLFDLTVTDERGRQEELQPTGHHKFYSEDAGGWVDTCDLRPGERLRGRQGPLAVASVSRRPGVERVYNMTVEAEHVYYVSAADVLSHNNSERLLPDSYWESKRAPKQVQPGIRQTVDMKPSARSRGEVYKSVSHYDERGRMTGQTHYTSHGEPDIHPSPHHHRYDPVTGTQLRNPETGTKIFPGEHPDLLPETNG